MLRTRFLLVSSLLCVLGLAGVMSACRHDSQSDLLETVQKRGELLAGVKFDSKPFGYLDTDGDLKGFDIELMRELAHRILGDAQQVEFQQVLSSTRVVAVNSGNVDVVAATMTITPDREKFVDFSEPYFVAHQAIIVPVDSQIQKLDDLNGQRVLFVLGTTSETNIKKRLPHAKYIGFKTSTDAFSALKAGRGDAMTTDDTILSGFLADACGFRMLNEKLSNEPYGLAFRQNEATQAFRLRVNEELAKMKQDGTLERLQAKWVKKALVTKVCPNS